MQFQQGQQQHPISCTIALQKSLKLVLLPSSNEFKYNILTALRGLRCMERTRSDLIQTLSPLEIPNVPQVNESEQLQVLRWEITVSMKVAVK